MEKRRGGKSMLEKRPRQGESYKKARFSKKPDQKNPMNNEEGEKESNRRNVRSETWEKEPPA